MMDHNYEPTFQIFGLTSLFLLNAWVVFPNMALALVTLTILAGSTLVILSVLVLLQKLFKKDTLKPDKTVNHDAVLKHLLGETLYDHYDFVGHQLGNQTVYKAGRLFYTVLYKDLYKLSQTYEITKDLDTMREQWVATQSDYHLIDIIKTRLEWLAQPENLERYQNQDPPEYILDLIDDHSFSKNNNPFDSFCLTVIINSPKVPIETVNALMAT